MEKLEKYVKLIDNLIKLNLYLLILALPISKSLIEITASLAIGLWLLKKIITRNFRIEPTALDGPILFYLLFIALSFLNTQFIFTSLRGFFFKTLEYIFLFFVIVESINSERDVKGFAAVILFSCALIGADGIFQYVKGYDIFRHYPVVTRNRLTASFQYPNGLGGWLVAVTPLCMSLAIFNLKNKLYRFATALLSILLLVCLVLNISRSAWLAFIPAILFLVWRKGDAAKKALLVFLIMLIIAVIAITMFGDREALSVYTVRDASILHRIGMVKLCWRMFVDHPFLGHGINTFMSIFENYLDAAAFGVTYAHNCYLQIAVETGIFSLLAFLWLIKRLFVSSLENINKRKEGFMKAAQTGILAGLLGYLVHSVFETNLYALQLAVLFYYLLGLAVGIQRIGDKH